MPEAVIVSIARSPIGRAATHHGAVHSHAAVVRCDNVGETPSGR